MNFNYDLMTWINYFIGAFICCFGSLMVGKIFLDKKIQNIKYVHYLIIIFLSIFTVFNGLIFNNVMKIFGTLLVLFIIYKIIYNENMVNSFLYSVITYILYLISEIILTILLAIIENIFGLTINVSSLARTIFINIAVPSIVCLFANILKYKIKSIANKLNINNILYVLILGIVTISIMISTLYRLYLNNWIIDYTFVLNIVITIGCSTLFLLALKQYLENKEISDKYALLNDYLKNSAELIEKYSSTIHKYKNNLIAIKGYIKSSDKDAEKYIDNLLGEYDNRKYNWFRKINNISLDSIRYVVYYKLSKAENNNLKIIVDVSNELKNIPTNLFTIKESNILLEFIGEFFDNAIFASNESKEKELNLLIYKENDMYKFVFSNTYKGKIDLSLINKNGYTTKGKGHGFGLYDIERTLRKNNWLNVKYELLDNYFVTTLTIIKK